MDSGQKPLLSFICKLYLAVKKQNQTQRPGIMISSLPLPFEIERDLIATNTGAERYIPFLTSEVQRLENSGADFIVMPCNSLHAFIDEIRYVVNIPVLSIVEETIHYMQQEKFNNVGLISTSATLQITSTNQS